MCWMLSTRVVSDRSKGAVIRSFHLFGVQTSVLPRHGNHGDVDVGEDVGGGAKNHHRAGIRMSSAITMKVYGRLSATLTIHIAVSPRLQEGRFSGISILYRSSGRQRSGPGPLAMTIGADFRRQPGGDERSDAVVLARSRRKFAGGRIITSFPTIRRRALVYADGCTAFVQESDGLDVGDAAE